MQALKGEKQSKVLPNCDPHELQHWLAWQDSSKNAIVGVMSWGQPIAV